MGELEFISGRRGLQGEEIVKSTLFCKVHYVLYSDIKQAKRVPVVPCSPHRLESTIISGYPAAI
jgi:hypothetical protein